MLVRAQGKEIQTQALDAFQVDPMLTRVYMLIDGKRTQQEIADALREYGRPGEKAMLVSRKLDRLYRELHLVELVDQPGKGKVYTKARVDRILGISRQLAKLSGTAGNGERAKPAGG